MAKEALFIPFLKFSRLILLWFCYRGHKCSFCLCIRLNYNHFLKWTFGHDYEDAHSLPCTGGGLLVSHVSILGNSMFTRGYQSYSQFNCLLKHMGLYLIGNIGKQHSRQLSANTVLNSCCPIQIRVLAKKNNIQGGLLQEQSGHSLFLAVQYPNTFLILGESQTRGESGSYFPLQIPKSTLQKRKAFM